MSYLTYMYEQFAETSKAWLRECTEQRAGYEPGLVPVV